MTEERDTEAGFAAPQTIAAGRLSDKSGLVFRSAAASAAAAKEQRGESWDEDPATNKEVATAINLNDDDDVKEEDKDNDPITLPESTHTLLCTEPINSVPFLVASLIAAMSILCLVIALLDYPWGNLKEVIPANVSKPVNAAQYCSILIALLMEEEIPTAVHLLRRMPKRYFERKFPDLKYSKFVCSCILRLVSGYLFLLNVLLILVQASDVLGIFYDVLALQFLQQLDDIAFSLARMNVLSKRMKIATTCKYFQTEFSESKLGRSKKLSAFLKGMYFFNLFGLLAGMLTVTVRQAKGFYTCKEITVRMPDRLWVGGIVQRPGSEYEEMILNYPYFNGVYRQEGSRDRRPVYVEQNKFDNTPFDKEAPEEGLGLTVKVGAKFMYCSSLNAWVFTHDHIRKSKHDDPECPWLLRSEETNVYDVEEYSGSWEIWAGVIGETTIGISCNECRDNADCNLNGECQNDGTCKCFDDIEGTTFLGPHCEVRLRDECRTIVGESYNETFTVMNQANSPGLDIVYNRPQYMYTGGYPGLNETDLVILLYSGNRWFGSYSEGGQILFLDELKDIYSFLIRNYHAFWDKAYEGEGTLIVSDITTNDNPVGVDFNWRGELGEQYGPFGVLYPFANQTGRGYYRCSDPVEPKPTSNVGRHLMNGGTFFEKYPHLLKHKMKKMKKP